VPQADGAGNNLMMGRYLQIGIIFNILFHIPGYVVWWFYTYDTIIWFGFDEATAVISQNYVYSIMLALLAQNIEMCFLEFFDVIDREKYVTTYSVVTNILSTGIIVGLVFYGVTDMVELGLAQTAINFLLLFTNIIFIVCKGWLDDYTEGLVKSFGLKVRENCVFYGDKCQRSFI
jgi:Na+-driven multidrug efflux pump